MENSLLYDLIYDRDLGDYREKLKKENNFHTKEIAESRAAMEKALGKEEINIVNAYIDNLFFYEEYLDILLNIRLLNYGVKIGMQLQKAFDNSDEE